MKCLVLRKILQSEILQLCVCCLEVICFAWIWPPCGRLDWVVSHSLTPVQDVALVELGQSDSDSDEGDGQDSDCEDDSDSDACSEITERNLKLPGQSEEEKKKKKRINIEVVSQQEQQDD